MTTTKHLTTSWQRRTRIAALGAALAVAATFGPGTLGTTRLGASEVAGYATVTAADTITATPVLAGVASAGS
ncbi:hypothetical protein OWR29_06890 [Actinoplanes sp. Pm04-4]|uniref:Uncharacterized protein n=1 Tax=Paractinoplanes pyxinae TaxID=2997416 RepID=A0ABT4ATY8_9ACTN|nr:hypothetical protein [Actinoplanes pyxinae]MCY1137721.1 hypothetical protein [Actinoplanes pyxinae]